MQKCMCIAKISTEVTVVGVAYCLCSPGILVTSLHGRRQYGFTDSQNWFYICKISQKLRSLGLAYSDFCDMTNIAPIHALPLCARSQLELVRQIQTAVCWGLSACRCCNVEQTTYM